MQFWIQPDSDTVTINNLQSEIGQLTGKQIDYVNKEREILIRLIEAKKRDKVSDGIIGDRIRLQMLQIIIDLHNIELSGEIK